ncbi:glycosyltransferase family protein [Gephyromycinifex aptenodytis]|uniref:glucose-1-phosphate cytidylyltransferase n=1 Tax=Gephyromycinifex aptenodytis TaxID=2716227 RepID=UPI001446DADB|nr:glucose-1-phosphate cytidylyltransferase [Gephyromycinifex aptenodytis]
MKVVLFCGGFGMRMRDGVDDVPKPMAMVGDRPLIWHVMRYYAHFGHREFILAMGYGARHISRYFLDYDETHSNDFVIEKGQVRPLATDVADWKITFVHTGVETPIGERLRRVAHHLGDDEFFLANYADVLTDAPLDDMIREFIAGDALASMLAVPPQSAFHIIEVDDRHIVGDIRSVATLPMRENGGYFVMRRELLDELEPGRDLVGDTLTRLAHQGRVRAYPYDGFWMPADTVKERVVLDRLAIAGDAPWQVWREREKVREPLIPQPLTGR